MSFHKIVKLLRINRWQVKWVQVICRSSLSVFIFYFLLSLFILWCPEHFWMYVDIV